MARTITVKGIGKASAKPDYVVFSMTLESKHKDYDKAMDMAADHIQQLNETLCGIGFEKGSVKTTNFSVRTDYDRVKDRNGNYQNVFCGYEVTHNLKLAFGFDMGRLSLALSANLKCFALNERCTQVDGYPVRRGMCFPIDKNTMYLFTHGIAPSVISPNRRYFQGGKSVPLPLKVVKHYGSGDMAQIATEILGLSKMNWNSFGLYSKLPCTIESSNEIARIGWLLSQFEGTLYDYRYFM